VAIALVVALRRRSPWPLVVVAAGVALADLASYGLKLASGRQRPFIDDPTLEPLVVTHTDFTFPSGHAATSFAGAVLLASLLPRRAAWPLFALAVAIAASRVYVGVHYPLDVLLGAVLGVLVGLAVRAVARDPRALRRLPAGLRRSRRGPR
jgi:undecaprenyl-diphosphatase